MTYELRTSLRANTQIRAAAAWWRENRPKAPEAFGFDLAAAFEIISELPSAGEPVRHSAISDLRRILLGTSQYFLYYVVNHKRHVVEILALWHTSRGSEPLSREATYLPLWLAATSAPRIEPAVPLVAVIHRACRFKSGGARPVAYARGTAIGGTAQAGCHFHPGC